MVTIWALALKQPGEKEMGGGQGEVRGEGRGREKGGGGKGRDTRERRGGR